MKCEKCQRTYPPLRMFKWDSKFYKKNRMFDKKMVCDNCYFDLKENTYKIGADGVLKRQSGMKIW